ncbi:hypothetical protein BGZ81_006639 [Podila clonocystis]|nr:hypothetical protein BGZ81_006639 [Podila clonocystis]
MAPQHVENLNNWMQTMFQLADQPDSDGVKGWSHDCFGRAKSNNFHGGGIATLIDNLTTAAMFTRERKYFQFAGVSTDLHVTYVSAATLGMVVLLECKVVKVGAGLANTTAVLKEKDTGRVLATGTHTKFNTDSRMNGSKL